MQFVVETGSLRTNLCLSTPISIGNVPLREIPRGTAEPYVIGFSVTPNSYQAYDNPVATFDTQDETTPPQSVQQAHSTNLEDLRNYIALLNWLSLIIKRTFFAAPPTYEECVFEAVNIKEQDDSCHVNGGADIIAYKPQYAVFR